MKSGDEPIHSSSNKSPRTMASKLYLLSYREYTLSVPFVLPHNDETCLKQVLSVQRREGVIELAFKGPKRWRKWT